MRTDRKVPIHIQELHVRNLGPLTEVHEDFGLFNLIYGKNERGKTYLVEFLMRSLFRAARTVLLRETDADGRLVVSGLEEEPVVFTPDSNPKLEDYWRDGGDDMPPNMHRLLVVKGAELALAESEPGGLNRTILKEYLSSEAVLDAIQGKISQTLQAAELKDGQIEGHKRGEIKRYRDLTDDIERLDELLDELDVLYSGGERAALIEELEQTGSQIESLERAKRHEAYRLVQEVAGLKRDLGTTTREDIRALRGAHLDHEIRRAGLEAKQTRMEELGTDPADYLWLKNAVNEYEKRSSAAGLDESRLFSSLEVIALIGAIGSIAVAGVGLFIGEVALTGLCLFSAFLAALGVGLTSYLRGRQKDQALLQAADVFEVNETLKEYEERFGKRHTNLAAMKATQEQLEQAFFEYEGVRRDVGDLEDALDQQEPMLRELLSRLGLDGIGFDDVGERIQELEQGVDVIEKKIQSRREAVGRLDVDPSDYLEQDPGVAYQKSHLESLEAKRDEVEQTIRTQEEGVNDLKQRICRETYDDISVEWEQLIENLRTVRQEIVDEYKSQVAEILAKVIIHEELEVMREREDENILSGLRSRHVAVPLKQVTGRYDRATLRNDQLVVTDAYNDFPLASLSTGAQEQVLLALRIGFASRILQQDTLFMILDDAFQHADWERREWLLDEVVELGQQGWQIIYLTMDDHLRDRFGERGEQVFGEAFRAINLG